MGMPKNLIPAAEKDEIYLNNVSKIGNSHENIVIYYDILEKEDLETVLAFCKTAEFSGDNEDESAEWYNRTLYAEDVPENIYKIMSKVYDFAEEHLQKLYDVKLDPWETDSFAFLIWRPGDAMVEHVPEWSVHHHNICTTFYINDDYEGGEIKFPEHELKVGVSSNSLLSFPGNESYRNFMDEVKKENKYTANLCFKFSGSTFAGEASFE